jgi:IPT/TIG domain
MGSCLVNSGKPFPWVHVGFVAVLTLTLSGWTCTTIVGFNSCLGVPPPRVVSLSPNVIPATADSVLLIVTGSDFVAQSQILWNGSAVPTTFVDSHRLQARITRQTFDKSFGSSVLISVNSPVTAALVGCPIAASSATLVLVIN